ncbi:hypothetical protein DDZ13_08125 [Coraliomargarita sinensis]|uniref:Uncharacterized protein n=1 Tax=Coraliomargarita sinensis TaxID=2174842 RepID=A0A317ZGI2_9BACT|nr:anti-phage defense-associated sirtuin Dsr2 [Coraliomargarita sinensis]PXA04002.1 hypothetical protein DDZ13_08125 [Coraliomargarita sinensis]
MKTDKGQGGTSVTKAEEFEVAENLRPYLNQIAERLWSGHAAIMVGSGFSKNAKLNSSASCSGFPDWSQLGDLFYEKVHGKLPDASGKYMNVLKLADEVHASLGRPVLDQLLRDSIPDLDYEPSALHLKLLQLPWTDVFTTNYDTLLERASTSVSNQRFDVVVNKEDLVYSSKPRIIKLHGSFPSERPFVITEEDYRKYPKVYAPFVNTVQQSLLENTLCLVGFSGDDPNFLQWIGWIRDNLGQLNAPKIFLVGVINLSSAQRKLLEMRNIVVLNMAECPDIDSNLYYEGLERFFDFLSSKEKTDSALGWPSSSSKLFPDPHKDRQEQFDATVSAWEKQRKSYPGWVVVPEDRRSSLWSYTEHWCYFLRENDDVDEWQDLRWFHELVWRMDKSLCPIFNDQAPLISRVLDKYRPKIWDDGSSRRSLEEEMEMWIGLQIHMLRYYREEGLHPEWDKTYSELLTRWEMLSPSQQSKVFYEQSLNALFSADIPKLKTSLSNWHPNESLPLMEAKRAMLLAEIGKVNEAAAILANALDQVRSKRNLKPVSNNYSLVSQEAYIMVLYKYVKDTASFHTELIESDAEEISEVRDLYRDKGNSEDDWVALSNNRIGDRKKEWEDLVRELRSKKRIEELKLYQERWNSLKRYKCDPWNEVRVFSAHLERPPKKFEAVSIISGFDVGRFSQTQHMGGDKELLFGYAFLRFFEDTGLVFRISDTTSEKNSAEGALRRISKYAPYWATATLLRLGDEKLVDVLYNRESLVRYSQPLVDQLIGDYLSILEKVKVDIVGGNRIYRDNFGVTLAAIVPEILSRLCTKCTDEKRFLLLNFLKGVYESEDRGKYKKIRTLTERLVTSFSSSHKAALVEKLLEFPILENLNIIDEGEFVNPLHFVDLTENEIRQLKGINCRDSVSEFLSKARSSNSKTRTWATLSLGNLYRWGLLNKSEQNQFAEALWSKLDQHGLPADTGFYRFAYLNMPCPENVKVVERIREFLHEAEFPVQSKRTEKNVHILAGDILLCRELLGANNFLKWRKKDIRMLTAKLSEWWDCDKSQLVQNKQQAGAWADIGNEFKSRFEKMENVLARIIVPQAVKLDLDDSLAVSRRILQELNDRNVTALRLKVALEIHESANSEMISSEVGQLLSSNSSEDVVEAIRAIDVLLSLPGDSEVVSVLDQTVNELALKIRWRQTTELPVSIDLMESVARKYPDLIVGEVKESILGGLDAISNETGYDIDSSAFSERLFLRVKTAGLASTLSEICFKNGEALPDPLRKWKAICRNPDEFAEVRNAWKACVATGKG